MNPVILAIESSCDETSASLIRNGKVLNNIIASQAVHRKYGGVVPELASRAHQQSIVRVVREALSGASITLDEVDAIAFTRGPGLLGSLLVGVSYAKGLALATGKPLIEVNHMKAHVLAHFIDQPVPDFPFLNLTVSGGHTQLIRVTNAHTMEVLGETQDDAVGEAFDKAAKLLGLPYPGGPMIDRYAQQGNPHAFKFPKTDMPALDFSFSGIKTAFLYFLREHTANDPAFITHRLPDICASLQHTLVTMLLSRVEQAAALTGITSVGISGGVSANSCLRHQFQIMGQKQNWKTFVPDFAYCTDNAAMIAMAAHFQYLRGDFCALDVTPLARMPIPS